MTLLHISNDRFKKYFFCKCFLTTAINLKSLFYFLFLSLLLTICCLDDSSLMIRKREYPTNVTAIPQFESLKISMDRALHDTQPCINAMYDAMASSALGFSTWSFAGVSCCNLTSDREISFLKVMHLWWNKNRKNNVLVLNMTNPILEMFYHGNFQHYSWRLIETVARNSQRYYQSINTKSVGLDGEYDHSQAVYIDNTANVVIKTKDQLRNAKVLDSKAQIYVDQCLYVEALNDLHKNLSIAERSNSPMQVMFVKRQLALLYMQLEDYNQAKKYLEEALTLSRSEAYLISDEYDILKIKLALNKRLGNHREEFTILKRLNELRDSIDYTDNEQNNINAITLKYQKGLYEERFRLNQTILEKELFLNQLFRVIFVLIFLIVVIVIIGYRMKIKNKTINLNREILMLEYEKLNLEKNISERNHNPIKSQSMDHNSPLVGVTYPIEKRGKVLEPSNSFGTSKLPDLLKSHLMTEENWIGFKQAFIEEFPLFYDNLKTYYPELTEYNLRVIFLTKLQLNNHEIASTLGVSYDAVKKAKQRLRKKVEEPSVEDFIKIWT